ncbi:MAG: response regulator transcription factor [Lachnospiraceae bacterium]|nr:response regulator transcription factor [Lachnospiraceae bacterium]
MRILVVEDEKALSDLIADRLRREKYLVDVSNDGETGLDNALSGMYDLLILDIMLPGVDGLTILKEVRKNSLDVKIIMLTARTQLEDKLAGFSSGANDYVPKPFHIDELAARVNAFLRMDKAVKQQLAYGKLLLDYDRSRIINSQTGESIPINNKEFQLLEYLMHNPERILSRDMIYDRIWGMESEAVSNNLEAYISFVRKKLRLLDADVTIKTVRGMGYRFEKENA